MIPKLKKPDRQNAMVLLENSWHFVDFQEKIIRCPPLRRRGQHDVGHVGAATGRGAKPRQAFRGALAEPHPPLSLRWVSQRTC